MSAELEKLREARAPFFSITLERTSLHALASFLALLSLGLSPSGGGRRGSRGRPGERRGGGACDARGAHGGQGGRGQFFFIILGSSFLRSPLEKRHGNHAFTSAPLHAHSLLFTAVALRSCG